METTLNKRPSLTLSTVANIGFTCSLLLIMLFTYTALSKLLEQDIFVFQMKLSPVKFMAQWATILGWLVPLVELFIVGLLLIRDFRTTGLYLSFFLLLAFEIYISAMLLSGLSLPCTCGGVISRLGWKGHLLFNAAFMLVAALPIFMNIRRKKLRE
jgi:putative oxidoreductase